MKTLSHTLMAASAAALLLAGCGGTSGGTTATDITVERGPLLYANVTDADGQVAAMQGNGVYRFETAPVYPVTSYGGVIDMNRNNVIDEGDVIASRLKLQTAEGTAATIVTSLAENAAIKTMLQQTFNLSETQIYNETPSSDKAIAALSDEVYKYSVEHNVSDPSQLTLEAMETLRTQIAARIEAYEASDLDAAALEQAMVQNETSLQVLTQTQAENVESQMQSVAEGQSSSAAGDQSENNASSTSAQSSSAQNGYTHGQTDDHGSSGASQSSAANENGNDGECNAECSSSSQSSSAEASELTKEQKYTLAYMWNEEKLAKDLYLALNDVWPSQTLYNIATKAETTHQAMVEELIETYDINITDLDAYETNYSEEELRAFGPGEFGVPDVQALYDTLYAKGVQSAQDALEVGCMVEVTDINDLNEDLLVAEGADDLVSVFENLRSGSYNHYWAFDTALKGMGVADGCCILGEDFCKTAEEYPATGGGKGGH